jgi:Protein of unknown function (DUF1552)
MFITKKHLSRRTVLRGVGASVALPLLDAMIPAGTALARTAAAPRMKMAFIYFPHGAIMLPKSASYPGNDQWTPSGVGREFKLSRILAPLAPYQKSLIVASHLGNKPAESAAVHAIVPGTWLSCVHPHETQDPYGGVTVDQMAAQHIGQDTPLPSLQVATEANGGGGVCDRDYGCSFSGTISFRTHTMPLPMEYQPHVVFERLFGQGVTPAERKAIGQRYTSILDMVSAQASTLDRVLGPADRSVLSDYMQSVREIERRVQKMEKVDLSHFKVPHVPEQVPASFPEEQALMFDMIALAWQANLTHIATMTMAHEVSNMTYPFIGVPDAFHPTSHHQFDPVKIEKLIKIQTYHTQKFAAFLKRLSEIPDGDGTLFDHAMILYGSNMSNSNAHNQYPLPTALVGGACGKIKGGQHLEYPPHTPLANLLLTMLRRAGIPQDHVGDSTGEMTEI